MNKQASIRAKSILAVLAGLATAVGAYEAVLYYFGHEVTERFYAVWALVFFLLLAWWVQEDSRERPNVYRPFEFGYLTFLWVIPYAPYYIIRTRGILGVLWVVVLVALFYLGYLLQLLVYAATR